MHIPAKLKTRWYYGAAAFFASLAVLPLTALVFVIFSNNHSDNILGNVPNQSYFSLVGAVSSFLSYIQLISVPAGLAALICWPAKTRRTSGRMILAGICTVILAFFLMGCTALIFANELEVSTLFPILFVYVFLGSIVTLGVPYIIAISISLLFKE